MRNVSERCQTIASSNRPPAVIAAPLPRQTCDEQRETLPDIFTGTVKRYPSHVAVRMAASDWRASGQRELTYAELRARALRFAAYLNTHGVVHADRVVLCLPRGLDQYVALLGTLHAGATYVPVDWSCPRERSMLIAQECSAAAIVTTSSRKADFANCARIVIALDDKLADVLAQHPTGKMSADPEDLAYVMYTSGSTGRPKGVMIRQRNIAAQVRAEATLMRATAEDVVFAGASLAFDTSVEEMWTAFGSGATLLICLEDDATNVDFLPSILDRHRVTIWCPVPSLLMMIDHPLPSVRIINVGGESCPLELVRRWAHSRRRMINTYGPTETSVAATWAELSADKPVTIGRPLPGFEVYIVDDSLRPVADGEEGELLIGGPAVGPGYLNQAKMTDVKFVVPPFAIRSSEQDRFFRTGDRARVNHEGEIEFLGRLDLQVKIRGYRVELGEIEALLVEDCAVAQAVVSAYAEPDETPLLVAFLTARAGQGIDVDRLRATARERLPSYMRPHAYIVQAKLPVLISGKINRQALERPQKLTPTLRIPEIPRNAIEAKLLEIWNVTFAPLTASTTDDFFNDLGGHSLLAARMVSLARKHPELRSVAIKDVYAAPTIRDLAKRLSELGSDHVAGVEPFRPVAQSRYLLCSIAQALGIIVIYTFAGLQWLMPYLAYTVVAASDTSSRVPALLAALAAFAAIPPLMLALAIAVKWIVIGRYKPGDYPLWGAYYFRWWFVRRFLNVVPTKFIAATPLMRTYLRLLGASVEAGAFVGCDNVDAPDLVSIGVNAIISEDAQLATTSIERGLLRIGRCVIGAHAFVGNMAVVGRNAAVGDAAILEDLSALGADTCIPAGETWTGSPAARRGRSDRVSVAPQSRQLRQWLVTLGLVAAALALPVVAVLPIAPAAFAVMQLNWATTGYIVLSPLFATFYVLAMCLFTVGMKYLLLGRVRPGTYSIWSWFYVRFWFATQLNQLALDILHAIYATLYVKPWFRALGARVGARAEISTASSVAHDLVDIGPESFIADDVAFGAPRIGQETIRLERTRVGRRTFIGNSALLPTGAVIGDATMVGVLSKPPDDRASAEAPNAIWLGSPPIRLPRRQETTSSCDETVRFTPTRRLVATRLGIEFVRVILSITVFIALFCVLLGVFGGLLKQPSGILRIASLFPALYLAFVCAAGALVIGLKWIVIGRYRPTTAPLWSLFVWRTELVTSTYENLVVPLLLEPLRGTLFINCFFRLMGCKIGKRVFTDTTDITEFDLVSVDDDAALNEDAGLQTHLFEDRVMKVSTVSIGKRATVGTRTVVLYDSIMEQDAQLGDLSVLMKGEVLPTGTAWEGSPARPAIMR